MLLATLLAALFATWQPPSGNHVKNALKRPVVIDGRNIYDPESMREHGFEYDCIGRP